MKSLRSVCMMSFLILLLTFSSAAADEKPIQKGDPFPEFKLPVPDDPAQRSYLGLSAGGKFSIQDIAADIVIIQIFHSG